MIPDSKTKVVASNVRLSSLVCLIVLFVLKKDFNASSSKYE